MAERSSPGDVTATSLFSPSSVSAISPQVTSALRNRRQAFPRRRECRKHGKAGVCSQLSWAPRPRPVRARRGPRRWLALTPAKQAPCYPRILCISSAGPGCSRQSRKPVALGAAVDRDDRAPHCEWPGERAEQHAIEHSVVMVGRAGRRAASLRRRVLKHLQRRLHALGEELIGQVAVCQRPGELQGADHQSERERIGLSRVGVWPGRGARRCRLRRPSVRR